MNNAKTGKKDDMNFQNDFLAGRRKIGEGVWLDCETAQAAFADLINAQDLLDEQFYARVLAHAVTCEVCLPLFNAMLNEKRKARTG